MHQKYGPLYRKAFLRHLDNISSPGDKLSKTIFLGIRSLNSMDKAYHDNDGLDLLITEYCLMVDLIELLTPRELIKIFPIDKRYDGDKWGVKDYFTTMAEIEKIGMDTVIGENAAALIGDYMNWDLRIFTVNLICLISDWMRYTEKSHQPAATDSDGKTLTLT